MPGDPRQYDRNSYPVGYPAYPHGQDGYRQPYDVQQQATSVSEDRTLPVFLPQENSGSNYTIRAKHILENIPRRMRADIVQPVNVRIERSELKKLADGMQSGNASQHRDSAAAIIVAVSLRAPDDAFYIEPASPETLWMENHLGSLADEFASWRWKITAKRPGRGTLQLIITARSIGGDGLTAETRLPDRLFDIRVLTNYTKFLWKWFTWISAAVLGGLLVQFGNDIIEVIKMIIQDGTGRGI